METLKLSHKIKNLTYQSMVACHDPVVVPRREHSFYLHCLAKEVFSPVPPDRWYFVPSHFNILMLFSLFYHFNLFDQFFLTNKIDTENSSSCNQNLLNWSLRLKGIPLSNLKMVKHS